MDLIVDNRAGVEEHLRRLGWIDATEAVRGLEVPGAGNMNRTLRARLQSATGDSRTLILKQAVPFVARHPQIPAPVDRLNAEAAFYRAIAPCGALARRTPKLLAEDPDEHLLCLEDLGEGADLTRLYLRSAASADEDAVGLLLDWLGTLHRLKPDAAAVPDNGAMRALNHRHIFEVPFEADNGVALSSAMKEQQAHLAADRALRRRVVELGARYLNNQGGVLLHGDYYPGSWLETPESSVAVIDPEFAFVGPAEFDVGVCNAHLIMAGFSESAIAACFRHYAEPAGFDPALARGFAGIEVIRRLLGVAQLPLAADDTTRCRWLAWAREAVSE